MFLLLLNYCARLPCLYSLKFRINIPIQHIHFQFTLMNNQLSSPFNCSQQRLYSLLHHVEGEGEGGRHSWTFLVWAEAANQWKECKEVGKDGKGKREGKNKNRWTKKGETRKILEKGEKPIFIFTFDLVRFM